MSANPLIKKLQIKPGQSLLLLNAPAGCQDELGELPAAVELTDSATGQFDLILFFAASSQELRQHLPTAVAALKPGAIFWIAYPKRTAAIVSDLTRDEGWQPLADVGYEGVAQVAINDTWTALRFKPSERTSVPDVVEAQYSGAKAALRPIYDRLAEAIHHLGDDVDFGPRKTYVAIHRKNQFAIIQASTNSRVDLGLRLKGMAATERLVPAGNFGSGSITHKISLTTPDQIDAELLAWLQTAYERVA